MLSPIGEILFWVLGFPVAFGIVWAMISILCWNQKRKSKKAEAEAEAWVKYVNADLPLKVVKQPAKQVGRLIRCIDV